MDTSNLIPSHRIAAEVGRATELLERRGFIVLRPTPITSTPTSADRKKRGNVHLSILKVYLTRFQNGRNMQLPVPSWGLTDPELSLALGHADLHRRCAELRSLGLLTDTYRGKMHRRDGSTVSFITKPGLVLLTTKS